MLPPSKNTNHKSHNFNNGSHTSHHPLESQITQLQQWFSHHPLVTNMIDTITPASRYLKIQIKDHQELYMYTFTTPGNNSSNDSPQNLNNYNTPSHKHSLQNARTYNLHKNKFRSLLCDHPHQINKPNITPNKPRNQHTLQEYAPTTAAYFDNGKVTHKCQ